jgi:hypothetical protein
MEIVCVFAQTLVVLLVIALFIVGIVTVIGALTPRQIARRSRAEIEEITSEGRRTMDDLSEQYLNDLYKEVTESPEQIRRRR